LESSHRRILRSSSIIGGASVFNILIGLIRLKAAALVLGPAGVGLIGLFQSFVTTASAVASIGLGNAGTRQVADALGKGEQAAIAAARRALFWGTAALALSGAALAWMLSGTIARQLFGDERLAGQVGWLGLAIGLTVVTGSQGALLTGLRRIGDIARLSVISALVSGIAGVAALAMLGEAGVIAFLLSAPIATFLVGWFFAARLPRLGDVHTPLAALSGEWRMMVSLGFAIMIGALASQGGQLLVRMIVQRDLGLISLGYFQAAWMLSMTYLGFVLNAMGTDYYPRLTASIREPEIASRLVNDQTEVALLLASPVLLVMLGAAPWILQILYSGDFREASAILRWQILGDVLKVSSWPLGYLLLASGDGRTFALTEIAVAGIFVLLVWFGIPHFGVAAAGLAFLAMYAVYLPLIYLLARRKTGFAWSGRVARLFVCLMAFASGIFVMSLLSEAAALISALILALVIFAAALRRLEQALPAPVGRLVSAIATRTERLVGRKRV
jgi:PST family polysaccharide transporter